MFDLCQAIEEHFAPFFGNARISGANLTTHVRIMGSPENTRVPIATYNRRVSKSKRKWQAVGGVAHLTEKGKEELKDRYDATDFERDGKGGKFDARFVVSGQRLPEIALWFIECPFRNSSKRVRRG